MTSDLIRHAATPIACGALLALTTLSFDLSAQTLREGYASTVRVLPNGTGNPLRLTDRDATVVFTGTRLVLRDDDGTETDLLTFGSSVFGSFTIALDANSVLFGESSNGELWRVPLDPTAGRVPAVVTSLTFNYDAALLAPNQVLVSAKTGGFSAADNDVVLVDVTTGATDPIAALPGASGPLVADGRGGFFYATSSSAFPAPPGAVDMLHFDSAAVQSAIGPTVLGPAQGTLVASGIDAAGDLVLDSDGDLLFTDFVNATIGEVNLGTNGSGLVTTLVQYSFSVPTAGALQFDGDVVTTVNDPTFEPFQPLGGGTLIAHESDFFSGASQLRRIEPARASLRSSTGPRVPLGPFDLITDGGPSNGTGVIALGFNLAYREVAVPIGLEQVIFWDPAMLNAWVVTPLTFDGNGRAAFSLVNPGFAIPIVLSAQVAYATSGGAAVGSTEAIDVVLRL